MCPNGTLVAIFPLAKHDGTWHNRHRADTTLGEGSLNVTPVFVSIPAALLARTGSRRRVAVEGHTVREVIDGLEREYPGLRFNLCYETGELRPFVNIFLERENVRFLQGLDTPVHPGAAIHVIHSVAGGSAARQ